MTLALASERRLLAQDEYEPVLRSHYPLVEDLSRDELVDLARWLRARRARARDIVRGRRRVASGKVDARGTANETASERGLAAKKQVFANGLKRVNARLATLQQAERHARNQARLRAALAARRQADTHHPDAGWTPGTGARPGPAATRRRVLQASRIGRVSQSVRNAQAARDSR